MKYIINQPREGFRFIAQSPDGEHLSYWNGRYCWVNYNESNFNAVLF